MWRHVLSTPVQLVILSVTSVASNVDKLVPFFPVDIPIKRVTFPLIFILASFLVIREITRRWTRRGRLNTAQLRVDTVVTAILSVLVLGLVSFALAANSG